MLLCLIVGYIGGNIIYEIKRKKEMKKMIQTMLIDMDKPNRWEWVRIENAKHASKNI